MAHGTLVRAAEKECSRVNFGMSKATLQNWLDGKTGPSVPTKPRRPQFKLLLFAAITTAASIDTLPVPGT